MNKSWSLLAVLVGLAFIGALSPLQGQTPAPVPPSATPPLRFPSTYVGAQAQGDRLQLNADHSFSLQEAGQAYHGTFTVNGNTLEFSITETNTKSTATIQGNSLIDGSGQTWVGPPLQAEDQSSGGGPGAVHEYKLLHHQYLNPQLHEVVIRIAGGSVSFDPGDQPCTFKAFTAPIGAVTSVEVIRKFSGEMLEIKVRDPAKNKVRNLNFAAIGSSLQSRNVGPAVLVSPPSASSELESIKRVLEHADAK